MMKRFLQRGLALLLGVSLLAADALAAGNIPPASDAAAVVERPGITIDSGKSFQTGVSVSNFAVSLSITAQGLAGGRYYAAVMDANTFQKDLGGTPSKLLTSQFGNPAAAGIKDTTHYLAAADAAADKFLTDGTPKTVPLGTLKGLGLSNTSTATAGDQKTEYYRSYVYLVVAGESSRDEHYAVGTFAIDNEGNLLEPTYLVRYLQNQEANDTKAAVTGTVDPNLTAQGSGTTLRDNGFTRKGYTFKGWDTNADFWKNWRAGEQGDDKYRYTEGDAPAYQPGNTLPYASSYAYDIVDLYAQWFPQVPEFHAETQTLPTSDTQKLKVNVAYTQQYELLTGDKGTTSTDTKKQYSVTSVQKLPAGLKVEPVNGSTTKWQITGTPTAQTDEETVVTIRVTDATNQTFDEIKVTIPKIEKGDQALRPDLDVMTGLQSNVLTETGDEGTEIKDGLLLGFYAEGQRDSNADGTGTLTDFYLNQVGNEALVYEYRPKPAEGAEQADWREVPLPEAYYGGLTSEERASLDASMAVGATERAQSTLAHGASAAAVTMVRDQPAWAAEYGYIAFESGLPVIHGLTENAEYEVRFKANSDYGASKAQTIRIVAGGGGAAGGSGHSLLFNLMGGAVYKVTETPAEEEGGEPVITEEDVTAALFGSPVTGLQAGDEVKLPSITLEENERMEFRKEGQEFLGFTDGVNTYTYPDDWTVTMPDSSVGLAAMWSGGASDPSAFAPIVFYDWDETTILGSIVVGKNDADAAKTQIETYTSTLYPENYDPETGLDGALYDERSVLTNKRGYSFGKWVEMDATYEDGQKVYTIYGEAIAIDSTSQKVEIPEPADLDLSDLSSGKVLKAAFRPNDEMVQSNNYLDREYTVTWDSFNRHADADSYSIKVRVQREKNGIGVQRCRDAALRVTMTSGTLDVNMLVSIAEVDDQIVEVAAPSAAEIVSVSVIDTGGVSNWVNGTVARSSAYRAEAGTTESRRGFVFEGNMVYINNVLDSATGTLAATHYAVAGLTVSKGNVAGTTSTGAVALRNQALQNLRDAYSAKNANGTHVGLEWKEMDDAIRLRTMPEAVTE